MIAPDNQRWREYLAEALAKVKLPDDPAKEPDQTLSWEGMDNDGDSE